MHTRIISAALLVTLAGARAAVAGPHTLYEFQCGSELAFVAVTADVTPDRDARTRRVRLEQLGPRTPQECGDEHPQGCITLPLQIEGELDHEVPVGTPFLALLRPHGAGEVMCASAADAVWLIRIPRWLAPSR